MKLPERERLQYIHDFLKRFGFMRVSDIIKTFRVSSPTATKAVKAYKKLAPLNMKFCEKTKFYLRLETFVDIEIPEAVETKSMVSVHVLEADREAVSASEYKHWEVYRAGVVALDLRRE